MSNDTLTCPKCSYENIVLTCGFCLQCGADLSHLVAPDDDSGVATAINDISTTLPATTALPLASCLKAAANSLGAACQESANGWQITVDVGNDRKQTVHILKNDDDAYQSVSFLSICGPASAGNAMALLEWNGQLTECAFAVRKINGQRMFVLTANVPQQLMNAHDVANTIRKIAHRSDRVEEKLNQGSDIY